MIYFKLFVKERSSMELLEGHLKNFMKENAIHADIVEHYPSDLKEQDIVITFVQLIHKDDIHKISGLRKQEMTHGIVFLSENPSLVFESFRMNPLHFIRMQDFENDFKITCDVLIDFLNQNNTMIHIECGSALIRLNVKSIIYAESYGHYLTLHTTNGEYRIREALSHFQERINHTLLVKVHKSFIINMNFIEEVVNESIRLIGNVQVPVGRSFRRTVMEKCREM